MTTSVFSEILEEVVQSLPGARGAIFVDWEGEAVDTCSTIGDTGIKLVGAYWGIVYRHLRASLKKLEAGSPIEVVMSFSRQLVVIRRVTDDYIVVFTLAEGSNLGRALGLMDWAAGKLRAEM